jgi:hypothetical protein
MRVYELISSNYSIWSHFAINLQLRPCLRWWLMRALLLWEQRVDKQAHLTAQVGNCKLSNWLSKQPSERGQNVDVVAQKLCFWRRGPRRPNVRKFLLKKIFEIISCSHLFQPQLYACAYIIYEIIKSSFSSAAPNEMRVLRVQIPRLHRPHPHTRAPACSQLSRHSSTRKFYMKASRGLSILTLVASTRRRPFRPRHKDLHPR